VVVFNGSGRTSTFRARPWRVCLCVCVCVCVRGGGGGEFMGESGEVCGVGVRKCTGLARKR
jgi:hypothetical protein